MVGADGMVQPESHGGVIVGLAGVKEEVLANDTLAGAIGSSSGQEIQYLQRDATHPVRWDDVVRNTVAVLESGVARLTIRVRITSSRIEDFSQENVASVARVNLSRVRAQQSRKIARALSICR